jgi:hypothetical protein
VSEFDEQRDDGVQNDSLGSQHLTHIANQLLRRNVIACLIFFLKRGNGQLPFGGSLYQVFDVWIARSP